MGSGSLHPSAAVGFERSAVEYERGRPGFPPAAAEWLSKELGLGPGVTVVDLAAGTGKLTRQLVTTGSSVIAVEPLHGMRAQLRIGLPEATLIGAVAEQLPLVSRSADAVTVANAWHWFDSEVALAEVHRVLRPGGRLAIVYNRRDESVEWVAAMSTIVDAHRGETPQYRSGRWRTAFDETALFDTLERTEFTWEQPMTVASFLDRITSISFIATLEDETRKIVLDAAEELVVEEFGDRQEFPMPHTTEIYTTRALC